MYTPFPPENHFPKSKVDEQIESGEYFLTESQKEKKKKAEKEKKTEGKSKKRQEEREAQFVPPEEKPAFGVAAADSKDNSQSTPKKRSADEMKSTKQSIDSLKEKFGQSKEKSKKKKRLLDFN